MLRWINNFLIAFKLLQNDKFGQKWRFLVEKDRVRTGNITAADGATVALSAQDFIATRGADGVATRDEHPERLFLHGNGAGAFEAGSWKQKWKC